jgi:aerobic carbon-monoxide dehydrogenase medium subunit
VKPAPFEYHAPEQVDELLALVGEGEGDTRVIAGGQSLVPMMNFRLAAPDTLVDLRRVEGIRYVRRDDAGHLAIGAGTRQSALLREDVVRGSWPILAEGASYIGHPQVRSRGTVCGSMAHHDSTAELPTLAVALDARMVVASSSGRRELPAEEFFVSHYTVALDDGEVLLEVRFPPLPENAGWSFMELARRRGDFALVGVAAIVEPDGEGRVRSVRLVLCGVGPKPHRVVAAEQTVAGAPVTDSLLDEVSRVVSDAVDPSDTPHASASYRREAAGVLAGRALAAAWERCGRG